MNPLAWDAPRFVVYGALFGIVSIRASATYAIGRGLIVGVARTRFRTVMQGASYLRASDLVARFGAPVVSVSFLTVGFQSLVLLAAGGLRMPMRRFIPALAFGATMWALVYGTVGFVGLELVRTAYLFSPALTIGVAVALVAATTGILLRRLARKVPENSVELHSVAGHSNP